MDRELVVDKAGILEYLLETLLPGKGGAFAAGDLQKAAEAIEDTLGALSGGLWRDIIWVDDPVLGHVGVGVLHPTAWLAHAVQIADERRDVVPYNADPEARVDDVVSITYARVELTKKVDLAR